MIKKIIASFFILLSFFANAQEAEMADSFRQDGKIYVVTTVIAIIFVCIVAYLIVIDRKVKKLEDDIKNKEL
jgi:hypothetical protein